jgi:hypothetical protein
VVAWFDDEGLIELDDAFIYLSPEFGGDDRLIEGRGAVGAISVDGAAVAGLEIDDDDARGDVRLATGDSGDVPAHRIEGLGGGCGLGARGRDQHRSE